MENLRRTYYVPFVATTLPPRTHYVQRVFATLLEYQSRKRGVISLYACFDNYTFSIAI